MKTLEEIKQEIKVREEAISQLKEEYKRVGVSISESELQLFQRRGVLVGALIRELTDGEDKYFLRRNINGGQNTALIKINSFEVKDYFINLFGIRISIYRQEEDFVIRQTDQIYLEDYGKVYELIPISEEHFQKHFDYAIKCITEGLKITSDHSFENEFETIEAPGMLTPDELAKWLTDFYELTHRQALAILSSSATRFVKDKELFLIDVTHLKPREKP